MLAQTIFILVSCRTDLKVPPFSYDHFDLPPVLYAVAEMLSVTNDAAPTTRYARLRGMGAAKPQMKSAAVADVVFDLKWFLLRKRAEWQCQWTMPIWVGQQI